PDSGRRRGDVMPTRHWVPRPFGSVSLWSAILLGGALMTVAAAQTSFDTLEFGAAAQATLRSQAIAAYTAQRPSPLPRLGSMTPSERRAAVDAFWGGGLSTADKLKIFDTFWDYADRKFAAFQNLVVDWPSLRDKYRAEVAAGVSRGRFAGIMN